MVVPGSTSIADRLLLLSFMLCLGKFKVLGKFNFYLGASLFSKGSATK
jgi:hypothetical protein